MAPGLGVTINETDKKVLETIKNGYTIWQESKMKTVGDESENVERAEFFEKNGVPP